uniref:DAGKc domain-containing protein n=1 Tax=Macrostomum lignano TaxID=282301 RepID=A0A1I8F3W9_9PLAT
MVGKQRRALSFDVSAWSLRRRLSTFNARKEGALTTATKDIIYFERRNVTADAHVHWKSPEHQRPPLQRAADPNVSCLLHPSHAEFGYLPAKAWKNSVDWTDSAVNGEHTWIDTGASGDFCYVGESDCCKSGSKKKCTACKIIIHTGCFAQLEKIAFRCKPTFREANLKNYRDGRHGESFQQKFPFNNKEVIAISCSWCKAAYHNKINCFMMHLIEESCNFGSHASIILPPSWIIKVPGKAKSRLSTRRRSSHGKTSFKRRKSKTGLQVPANAAAAAAAAAPPPLPPLWTRNRSSAVAATVEVRLMDPRVPPPQPLLLLAPSVPPHQPRAPPEHAVHDQPVPSPHVRPVLVFINPRSGGNQGAKLMHKFLWLLNPRQVFDMAQHTPSFALELFRKVPESEDTGVRRRRHCRLGAVYHRQAGHQSLSTGCHSAAGTGNDLARTWNITVEPNQDCQQEPDPTDRSTGRPYLSVRLRSIIKASLARTEAKWLTW